MGFQIVGSTPSAMCESCAYTVGCCVPSALGLYTRRHRQALKTCAWCIAMENEESKREARYTHCADSILIATSTEY